MEAMVKENPRVQMRLKVTPASPAPLLHLENVILAVNFLAGSICQLRRRVVTH